MPLSSERWKEVSPSQLAWEREALDIIRQGLPDCEPYRAWSNFEFIADDGSINEVDLLVFTPQGFFLVEIKSRRGVLAGDAVTWRWTHEGREIVMDNPIFLANRKAKKLKALLSRQKACREIRFPFIDALILCSSETLDCRLQGTARLRVCLRDAPAEAGRPPRAGILAALRRREGEGLGPTPYGQFDAPAARAICRAMEQAGIRQSQRARRVGDYWLANLFFENPLGLYQDWEAEHFQLPSSKRFVRLYLAAASSSSSERETLKRAARREYEILDNLRHQNILLVHTASCHPDPSPGAGFSGRFDHPRGRFNWSASHSEDGGRPRETGKMPTGRRPVNRFNRSLLYPAATNASQGKETEPGGPVPSGSPHGRRAVVRDRATSDDSDRRNACRVIVAVRPARLVNPDRRLLLKRSDPAEPDNLQAWAFRRFSLASTPPVENEVTSVPVGQRPSFEKPLLQKGLST